MDKPFLVFDASLIKQAEIDEVVDSLASRWLGTENSGCTGCSAGFEPVARGNWMGAASDPGRGNSADVGLAGRQRVPRMN